MGTDGCRDPKKRLEFFLSFIRTGKTDIIEERRLDIVIDENESKGPICVL